MSRAITRRRPRRATTIPLAPPSLAGSCDLPGGYERATLHASLFGLAPCGVLPAIHLAVNAVRSYRTFSPLPRRAPFGDSIEAVCFLCHFPSGHPDRGLPGALPCGVRTFLPARPDRGQGARSGRLANCGGLSKSELSVCVLADVVLLELLVEIAPRCVNHLGRLRNVPPVLSEHPDEERALGVFLEVAQRSRPLTAIIS